MKILHSSDWHLGQSFFTKSRKAEHQAFLHWLVQQVELHQVDAVIVAGDIFDTGTPPSYARELYNQFVVSLSQTGATLVVLGGNHDSVATLNESKQLLACLNTHVIANCSEELSTQLLELSRRDGSSGALLCAVPFIRPRDLISSQAGESGLEKRQALGDAIQQHYQQLYQLANEHNQHQQRTLPIIATGHLSALGVSQSDSVRDIYIGTLDGFPAKDFPAFDYIALGHIHRPQIVAKQNHIRYSGSPIPLSFDELGSSKQVLMVEFADGKLNDISALAVPNFQAMAVLKGSLQQIEQQLAQYDQADHASTSANSCTWLSIEVEVDDYLSDLQQRVQQLTEDKAVEVLQLRRARPQQRQALQQAARETLAELTPAEVFQKRLALEDFNTEDAKARQQRISEQFQRITAEVISQESAE